MKSHDTRLLPRSIDIPLFRHGMTTIYGGPSRDCPPGWFFVKLAEEIDMPCDVDLPVRDFSVPSERALLRAMERTLPALHRGDQPVYVGCMGGIGRTGLFIGALVKTALTKPRVKIGPGFFWKDADGEDAIRATRAGFRKHALETEEQERLIVGLDVQGVARMAWKMSGGN